MRLSRTPGSASRLLAEKAAIGAHVGDARLHQIIETARHHVALQHFRREPHRAGEALEHIWRGLVEQHLDEHQEAKAEHLRIEPRAIALDIAVALQPLQPLADRGRGQADLLGQLDIGDSAVSLQDGEDFPVNLVDIAHIRCIARSFPDYLR